MASTNSFSSIADATAATVAIAVRESSRSRRAVRWAAKHLVPHAHRVVLLHVIPAVDSIPSPSGHRVPVDQMDKEVVEMYIEDLKSKVQQVFFPYRKLCGSKNVEILVLEGTNPVPAILSYVSDLGTKNLVFGATSNWVRRVLKGPDVPTTFLKLAPSSCNIFVVSRHKLTMKFAKQAVSDDPSICPQIEVVSHKKFLQRQKLLSMWSLEGNGASLTSERTDVGSLSQAFSYQSSVIDGEISETALALPHSGVKKWGRYDAMTSLKDIPFVLLHQNRADEQTNEALKLKLELQKTLVMYNQVCDDLVRAKKKIQLLSFECSEESKKVKEAIEREEVLKRIAADERVKHLEAIKEVEEARELLAMEALDRHKAEVFASKVSSEKLEVVDVLFSKAKRCRRYSKNEIEVATDNFSETNKIGEGSYGNVYKCKLDHTPVAVKVLRQDTRSKKEEFLREVEILSRLRHPNMVLLLGVCPENACLVYEYMENKSLEDQLFCRDDEKPIPWYIRFLIIFEVACGLAFLHGTKPEPIVHRDLKPGNILLDRNYVAKIGDVGLAKLISDVVPDYLTEYKETVLAGTFYYMDPEYQQTGTVRPKSDLYALGVIALQLLTGKHPKGLIVSVENAINRGCLNDVLDKSTSGWPLVEAERLAKLALKCSRLRCRDRPDLELEVLPELEELVNMTSVSSKLRQCNVHVPSHFVCPILQKIMEDPYVAADGYTYEHRAIKAWLEKSKVSPVTKLVLPHASLIRNHSLCSAIKEWKSNAASSTS